MRLNYLGLDLRFNVLCGSVNKFINFILTSHREYTFTQILAESFDLSTILLHLALIFSMSVLGFSS